MFIRSKRVSSSGAFMRHSTLGALVALFALAACQDEVAGAEQADNTARNERDRDGANPTPVDQGNDEDDLRIVQDIRKALVDDDQLSLDAHNAKVICVDGLVTLRGPVASDAERTAVENIATRVAGVTRVDNQLEVD